MLHLADHIRPLLRDHDCVIIPDFGGLVADVSSARAQPGRQVLSPPTKLVAFNQALTRNDGLLVDALSQHTGLSIAQAREAVRTAVANLQQELDETNRTELPGVGIFRRAVGRGLAFEYTGTDNLLAAAFGLPELAARPVRATDARPKYPQPALRGAAGRRSRLARIVPVGLISAVAGLLLLINYQVGQRPGYLPTSWQAQLPTVQWAQRSAPVVAEPQQATLGQHDFGNPAITEEGITPLESAEPVPVPETVAPEATPTASIATVSPSNSASGTATAAVPSEVKIPVIEPVASATPAVTPAAAAVATPAKPKAVSAASTAIKTRTGRYYVIAGAYSSLAHAERGRKVLARAGRPARIILPHFGTRFYRLTAGDYPDLASAQREAQRLRITTRSDYNTLKF